eukprot:3626879-Karenia_brevis.AAC.1
MFVIHQNAHNVHVSGVSSSGFREEPTSENICGGSSTGMAESVAVKATRKANVHDASDLVVVNNA